VIAEALLRGVGCRGYRLRVVAYANELGDPAS
jgi:hypothetical protein